MTNRRMEKFYQRSTRQGQRRQVEGPGFARMFGFEYGPPHLSCGLSLSRIL